MVVLLGVLIIIASCLAISFYTKKMKIQNIEEYNQVEDLKRRIDELDDDNVETTVEGTGKIIVPDAVDPDDATRKSTQKEDCKVYTVGPKQKIEKTVVGSDEKTETFVNTEIERVEDEKNDNPIKEEESLVEKILKNKKDEE